MEDPHATLSFQKFWDWLVTHPNCIVRAGTPETILYDAEDLHWHFASEDPGTLLVQILQGKRLIGELFVIPDQVTYVQAVPGEEHEEVAFELISETESDRVVAYFFVLSHGFETEEPFTPGRVH